MFYNFTFNEFIISTINYLRSLQPAAEEGEGKFKKPREKEPGMMYFSYIPPGMTPKIVTEIFKKHGEVGHVFFEQTGVIYQCICLSWILIFC